MSDANHQEDQHGSCEGSDATGQERSSRLRSPDAAIERVFTPLLGEFRFQDACEIIVGAATLAIPVAFTEEVWNLSSQLPWANVIGVLLVSITTVALFVYFIYYKGRLRKQFRKFLMRTFAGYAMTLVVVAVILLLFKKCPWQSDPATAIRRVILVGFPACYSATVVDSLR